MRHPSLPVAALLLGLAAAPAFAQNSSQSVTQAAPAGPVTEAAVRTLEQNRRVSVGLPPATPPRPAEARAVPQRRLALAAER